MNLKNTISDIKIDKNAIIYAFLIMPFLDLDGLWAMTGGEIRYAWGLLALGILCVRIFGTGQAIYLDNFNVFYMLYMFITLWSALLNGTLSFGMIYSFVIIGVVIQGIHYKKQEVIKGMAYAMVLLIIINILTMFMFEEQVYITAETPISGRYSGLVGGRNAFVTFFVLACNIVLYYYYKYKDKKVKFVGYAIWLVGCVQVFWAKSVDSTVILRSTTGMLIITINIMLIIFRKKINIPKWAYFTVIAIINILLVGFHELILNTHIVLDVLKMLGRGNDLSQRTYIWAASLTEIKESMETLLWGNGRGVMFEVPIRKNIFRYLDTHNMFLQVLYNSGILGFLAWCGCVCSAVWSKRKKDTFQVLFIGFICFMIGGLAESPIDKFLFWITLGLMNEEKMESMC